MERTFGSSRRIPIKKTIIKRGNGNYAQNQRQQKKTKEFSDFVTQIAEKRSTIESLNTEIASITANIDSLKVNLKAKRAALKIAEKEVGKLEAKKSKEEQKVAEEAKKAEAETMLKKLMADGMSAEEILAKLK